MSVVKQAVLLLLLAAMGANAEPEGTAVPDLHGCDSLNQKLSADHLHKIFGDWVLVWGVSDEPHESELLTNLSSSVIELRLLPDNSSVAYNERNMFHDKSCTKYFINMSMPSDPEHHSMHVHGGTWEKDGALADFNDTGEVYFFETCSDCLIMHFKSKPQYLLSYRRLGHHQDVEQVKTLHDDYSKLAGCVGITHHSLFTYDGAAEFCPEGHPTVVAEPEVS